MDQNELRALENQCIQDQAPPCSASCPLHVNVRGALGALTQGDFNGALQTILKQLPFPGIVGRICEQPCRENCNRGAAGETLQIAALERAAAAYGALPEGRRPLPRRGRRVAVIGGGLSGLTAAFDLTRKGHTVTLFEATERLGGSLWKVPEDRLPHELLATEIARAVSDDIEVRLNSPVEAVALAELHGNFEAIYLGVGREGAVAFAAFLVDIDPVTFAGAEPGIFVGGRALRRSPAFIESISTGRRAAVSIDRYLQKASLTASRDNEGTYITRLYTNLEGIVPTAAVPADSIAGYSREEAVQEAGRCLQCQCLECVKACAYLEHYESYPRQYVRQIYNNLSIVMGTRQFNTLINSCSLCGLCGAVCPEDLNMATVCRSARELMVQQDRMPPSAHEFALRDMAFSNGPSATLARRAPGSDRSDYIFFPGCQLSASAPEHVAQTYAYLRERLPNVSLLLRCCGAPADWAGRADLRSKVLVDFKAEYEALGGGKLIVACSSCYQIFKTHWPELPLVSLWEIFAAAGLPATGAPGEALPLAIHDPCTTRYEAGIQESAREILRRLGYPFEELPLNRERTECCSYGGLLWLANRELAHEVVQRRIAAHPAGYVTYCAMCRDFFADQGKPTLHLLDLFYEQDLIGRAIRRGPGFSQRHDNRAQLKQRLLSELWEETVSAGKAMPMLLWLDEEVAARIDARLILEEDIRQVIHYAEATGSRFVNPTSGHYLASYKPANVTYWVEYMPEAEGYRIYNAYSHRMEIKLRARDQEVHG